MTDDDKKIVETTTALVDASAKLDYSLIVQLLKTLWRLLGGGTLMHDLNDPCAPTSSGLPAKNVVTVNGTSYIEATGFNESPPGVTIGYVLARIFRMSDPIKNPPTDISDPTYQLFTVGTVDVTGMYYSFLNSNSQMIPGAQGGGSNNNLLVTWARSKFGDPWIPVRANRQFIGVDSNTGTGGGSTPPGGSPPPPHP
jgi:hypothetical protein